LVCSSIQSIQQLGCESINNSSFTHGNKRPKIVVPLQQISWLQFQWKASMVEDEVQYLFSKITFHKYFSEFSLFSTFRAFVKLWYQMVFTLIIRPSENLHAKSIKRGKERKNESENTEWQNLRCRLTFSFLAKSLQTFVVDLLSHAQQEHWIAAVKFNRKSTRRKGKEKRLLLRTVRCRDNPDNAQWECAEEWSMWVCPLQQKVRHPKKKKKRKEKKTWIIDENWVFSAAPLEQWCPIPFQCIHT
jgi:hypothetical protein